MKGDRHAVFDYIFSKADEIGYMGLDSAGSGKFQDDLENDGTLKEIAGEQLSRKYIKDTVLNNYSKKQRYISKEDILKTISGINESDIVGLKSDLENGVFSIAISTASIKCTSSSFGEWQTVIKRFGRKVPTEIRFAFLTCGGVEKSPVEVSEVKDILSSYGITPFIVKPHEPAVEINDLIKLKKKKSNSKTSIRISKPFLLLAGISGTGKTRFVRKQAEATGSLKETYCLTSVRPDWHEPSDLLGYISRMNGKAEYVTTCVLQFICKAWCAIVDAGLTIDMQNLDDQGGRLVVRGDREELDDVLPYWLCLDEMNLAPVEQYFADYLSVLETREWLWEGDGFCYTCDTLLNPATIREVADNIQFRASLGFDEAQYDGIWALICEHGLGIPFNLMVAGTVNMDETTHGFSRKVIDRALSFDFGEFFPNDYAHFFAPNSLNKTMSYPIWSHACKEELVGTADADGEKSIAFLSAVNTVLANTPFELAYRALNELLLAVISTQPLDELTLKAVWDDFLMCKVLPRIEGDLDKLAISSSANSNEPKVLLKELESILEKEVFFDIWDKEKGDPLARPDLYLETVKGDDKEIRISCRSKGKLKWMQDRLSAAGFTSFWP